MVTLTAQEIADKASTTRNGTFVVVSDNRYRDAKDFMIGEVVEAINDEETMISANGAKIRLRNGSQILLTDHQDGTRLRGLIVKAWWLSPLSNRSSVHQEVLDELRVITVDRGPL